MGFPDGRQSKMAASYELGAAFPIAPAVPIIPESKPAILLFLLF
jgi:hypothetical protein